MMLFLLALLIVSDFHDAVSCTVQGHVYRMSEQDTLEWARADSCEGVRSEKDGSSLVLYSPTHWVRVIVPAEYGHRRFMYRWGANLAHLGTDTIPIEWGYVEKG